MTVSFFRTVFKAARFLCLGASVALAVARAAEYLPDAATHLGTIVINGDDRFTTNTEVTLTIHATDPGTGVSQMRFSNDDQNWSAPEPYGTNKLWQLSVTPEDFPPTMNTVLKTVYVRVSYGDGTWAKAFSDGIIFARSALDVPIVTDIWMMQKRPTNYDSSLPLGSDKNPYIVPPGGNEVAFDTLMHMFVTNYGFYRAEPQPWETNVPPMTNVEVMNLHLGAGTYQTHGDFGGRRSSLGWSPVTGARIRGAGKDATVLIMVGGNTNTYASVLGNWAGSGMAGYDNLEISDLTVDANMHENGITNTPWRRDGIVFSGNNVQLRRLRVKGFGSRISGDEPAGMAGHNSGAWRLYNFHIEDCEVIAPQNINAYEPLMIGYEGGGKDASGNLLYWANFVMRNNYVNGLMYNGNSPVDPYSSLFSERGSHGTGLGGCTNSIIEDNLVEHVMDGYYNEVYDIDSVLIRNNHFRDVIGGVSFHTGAAQWLRFEGNLVELDPHYYTTPSTSGGIASDFGSRWGFGVDETLRAPLVQVVVVSNTFQFTGQARPPSNSLSASFASASMSGSALFESNNVIGLNVGNIRWYRVQGFPITYYEQQADILDSQKPPPMIPKNNYREDGTVSEVYPYVLDKSLPRPVVVPGQTIQFPAPLINNQAAAVVIGLPATNLIDSSGTFSWTPTSDNIGKYVASFYSSTSRTSDPRRTLITVVSGLSSQNPFYFKSGLRGYWKLNESSGSVLRDSSGNNNNIPVPSTAKPYLDMGVPGHRPGQTALHFRNTNPTKLWTVFSSNSAPLVFGLPPCYQAFIEQTTVLWQPFTVSYWFNCDHVPTNCENILDIGTMLDFGVNKSSATNMAELFFAFPASPELQWSKGVYTQPVKVSIQQWHHFVLVYDGVGATVFLDDVKQWNIPCGQIEYFKPSASVILLGGHWTTDNYSGSLSELAIWNRPLSDSEISDLYSSQQQGGTFPNLYAVPKPSNLRLR